MTAGSSVPEAARAAEWVRAAATAHEQFGCGHTGDLLVYVAGCLLALSDRAVAAASVELRQEVDRLSAECEALRGTVAEERADLAAQIEALAPEPVAGDVYRTGQYRAFIAAADWVRTGQLSRRV